MQWMLSESESFRQLTRLLSKPTRTGRSADVFLQTPSKYMTCLQVSGSQCKVSTELNLIFGSVARGASSEYFRFNGTFIVLPQVFYDIIATKDLLDIFQIPVIDFLESIVSAFAGVVTSACDHRLTFGVALFSAVVLDITDSLSSVLYPKNMRS